MADFILTFFVAMFGGAIGSFLNVVVWRLPNKMSLIEPGSFCPKCKHPIRFYDNIPILGWILLKGKCRDCKQPISFRYPLIETICFLLAGTIFYAIVCLSWTPSQSSLLYWDGMNRYLFSSEEWADSFRYFQPNDYESLLQTSFIVTALWSMFLFSFLAAALIEWDQLEIPRSLILFVVCLSLVAFLVQGFFLSQSIDYNLLFLIPFIGLTSLFYPVSKQKHFYCFALLSGFLCGYDFLIPIGSISIPVFCPVLLLGPISFLWDQFKGKNANLLILFFLTILFLVI